MAVRVTRALQAKGWIRIPHRPCDYPELKELSMWRCGGGHAPSPLLVLGSQSEPKALNRVCETLEYTSGCVTVHLKGQDKGQTAKEWCHEQSDTVLKFIDVMYESWMHVLCYSTGALLALHLADKHPDRIGTISIIDTPFLSQSMMEQLSLRQRWAAAQRDVNIPDEEVKAIEAALAEEQVPSSPVNNDTALFEGVLRGEVSPCFRRKDSLVPAPLPDDHPPLMHPLLVVTPKKNPLMGKDSLQIMRKQMFVKKAVEIDADHTGLLKDGAEKTAAAIDDFLNMYSTQMEVEREWNKVAQRRLSSATSMMDAKEPGEGGEEKGKKKKKKK
eukprot:Sspe_Gene.5269::Locus_1733_Transcript_1_1_Confidence_1.000_Length_1082::g.5269::m.5269